MRISRIIPWAGTAFALALSATACGDATGSPSGVSLSPDLAGVLVSTIESVIFDGVFQSNSAAALAAGVTVTCDLSGSALVKGTNDLRTSTGTLTASFHACNSSTIGGLIIDGNVTDTSADTTETLTGDVTLSGNQSGSCHIDVTITPHSNSNYTASGMVCGTSVSNTPI